MKINFDSKEMAKLKKLIDNNNLSLKIMDAYSGVLNEKPDIITKDMIDSIKNDTGVDDRYAYYVLLSNVLGLDILDEVGRQIGDEYVLSSLNVLNTDTYYDYPFYKDIRFDTIKSDKWEFKYESLKPYELCVYNGISESDDLKEIYNMGFFTREYRYPAVLEDGNEWMTLLPNEIESMRADIDRVSGKVVTFGLGLGCYAYMTAIKDDVESVTIVDKSQEVIDMFNTYILPQFKCKDKIKVVCKDAYAYIKEDMEREHFDYAFVDIWHDVSDGVDMYIRCKKLEDYAPNTTFLYWIEDLILSYLKNYIFDGVISEMVLEGNGNLPKCIKDMAIDSVDDLLKLLSKDSLRNIAKDIDVELFERK